MSAISSSGLGGRVFCIAPREPLKPQRRGSSRSFHARCLTKICALTRIILETDAVAIASRVSRPKADTAGEIVINEQTILSACESLARTLVGLGVFSRVRTDQSSICDSRLNSQGAAGKADRTVLSVRSLLPAEAMRSGAAWEGSFVDSEYIDTRRFIDSGVCTSLGRRERK